MDKVKDTMRKGFEKATRINEERKFCTLLAPQPHSLVSLLMAMYTAVQDQKKDALQTTWPAQEHHTSITGGIDSHLGKVSHTSDTTAPAGKPSMGQPSGNP